MAWADASFLIGLMDQGDPWHARAKQAAPKLLASTPWSTHALILGEVVAVIGSRRGGKAARTAYEMVRDTCQVRVPTLAEMDDAMVHVVRRAGRLSLSDALLVHYAGPGGTVLSFDSDFDTVGVERLP